MKFTHRSSILFAAPIACFVTCFGACTASDTSNSDDGGGTGGTDEPAPNSSGGGGASGGKGGSGGRGGSGAVGGQTTDVGAGGTAVASGWWNNAWPLRRSLSVNLPSDTASQDLPLLVALTQQQLGSGSLSEKAAGLRFVDKGGALLPHEVDTVSDTRLLVWVKRPQSSDAWWLYYGNLAAPALPKAHAQEVWGADSVVWHLGDNGNESGPGGFDATNEGGSFGEGFIGRAYMGDSTKRSSMALSREATANKRLLAGASALTLSAWVKPTDFKLLGDKPFDRQVVSIGTSKADSNYNHAAAFLAVGLEKTGSPGGEVVAGIRPTGDEETIRSPGAVSANTWTHVAAVFDIALKRGRFFINGAPSGGWMNRGDIETTMFDAAYESKSAHIGASAGGGYGYFDGGIDEVRLERRQRDETSLLNMYLNMKSPETTVKVGPEDAR